ncbi:uncharacterized protein LOC111637833 [Centruroides sculpturatus]|uniref:uncharacterized protein LOC111637833 n=1 Tax=Centruroides sculpturatus TaxID=218467 RepID=UPI000C6DBDDC|nr:uncharacterized protein LOC111637833 [Centruroides sculpturatus]
MEPPTLMQATSSNQDNIYATRSTFNITILTINTQRSKAASSVLQKMADEYRADIVLIQEPYLVNNSLMRFGRWRTFLDQDFCRVIKAGILVCNKNLKVNFCSNFSTSFVTTTLLSHNNKQLYFSSVYCSPAEDIQHLIADLQNISNNIRNHFWVISGDFNAKSPTWHSPEEDPRGYIVREFMAQNNLVSCNTSQLPTYYSTRGESWIDLYLASIKAHRSISYCSTLDENGASDHRYIKTTITTNDPAIESNVIKIKKTNWMQFQDLFKRYWPPLSIR